MTPIVSFPHAGWLGSLVARKIRAWSDTRKPPRHLTIQERMAALEPENEKWRPS